MLCSGVLYSDVYYIMHSQSNESQYNSNASSRDNIDRNKEREIEKTNKSSVLFVPMFNLDTGQ